MSHIKTARVSLWWCQDCCLTPQLSRYSDGLDAALTNKRRSIPDRGKRFFSFFHMVQTGFGAHKASYSVGTRGSSRQRCEGVKLTTSI
jgi:hypothetical protein